MEGNMTRKSIEERLAQLEAQKKTLQARLTKVERARDTRRKVLLGAFILHRIEDGRESTADYLRDFVRRELPGFLIRDTDKMLFDDLIGSAKPTK
jgi:histidinol-phosphate/aromatic aminotransferase/cobyric acid decarboxylase-like protein